MLDFYRSRIFFAVVLVGVFAPNKSFAEQNQAEQSQIVPSVVGFEVIDVATNKPFSPLKDGDVIDLAHFSEQGLNVRALTQPAVVESVVFELDQVKRFRHETAAPYALNGDNGGQYNRWQPRLGKHVMKATPFAHGEPGVAAQISFLVVKDDLSSTPKPNAEAVNEASDVIQSRTRLSEAVDEVIIREVSNEESKHEPAGVEEDLDLPQVEVNKVTLSETVASQERVIDSGSSAKLVNASISHKAISKTKQSIVFELQATQVVPPTDSSATGKCAGIYDPDNSKLTVGCTHSVEGPTIAGVFIGGYRKNGKLVCELAQATSPFVGSCVLEEALAGTFESRQLYVSVHSKAFPSGEIRGQIN